MKTIVKNIHSRINTRANDANKEKAYGLYTPKEGRFYWSFHTIGDPRYEELYRFEPNGHHNNHSGFYN